MIRRISTTVVSTPVDPDRIAETLTNLVASARRSDACVRQRLESKPGYQGSFDELEDLVRYADRQAVPLGTTLRLWAQTRRHNDEFATSESGVDLILSQRVVTESRRGLELVYA